MVKDSSKVVKFPLEPIKSLQYDLFGTFHSNDPDAVSNTVETWDAIPKYAINSKQAAKLRTADGLSMPHDFSYRHSEGSYKLTIQPALIRQSNGSYKAFFPGPTEEVVEEALKKIFIERNYGIHDVQNSESWVRFTLRMVQKILKKQGRARSINQIKLAIQVMNKAVLTITKDGDEWWSGSILQDLVTVGRAEYLEDRKAQHIARLPLFISLGINRMKYRQFSFDRLLMLDPQLSRWIYRRLVNRYVQASMGNTYHLMYSTMANSGLLAQASMKGNREKITEALEELVQKEVLLSYKAELQKDGRKIVDVKYTFTPHPTFVGEQKAANSRAREGGKVLSGEKAFDAIR